MRCQVFYLIPKKIDRKVRIIVPNAITLKCVVGIHTMDVSFGKLRLSKKQGGGYTMKNIKAIFIVHYAMK